MGQTTDAAAPQKDTVERKHGVARSGDRSVSITKIEERGARLAAALRACGVDPDDCVAILMRNDFVFLESLVASNLIGAYAVPLNWHQTGEETAYILRDSGTKVLLAHADLARAIAADIPPGVRVVVAATPEDIGLEYHVPASQCIVPDFAVDIEDLIASHEPLSDRRHANTRGSIVYTSGTTGQPKGVKRFPLHGEAATRFTKLSEDWWGLTPGVSTAMAGPMYHSAPNIYAKAATRSGGNITLMPRFDAEELLRIIERDRVSHIHIVPTMFIRLLRLPAEVRARYDVSSLRFVVHGAAPCPPEVKRAMIEWWGPVIYEYYGATEVGMVTRSTSQDWLDKPGTVGKVWPGREVRIYGENGERLGPNQPGDIYCSLSVVPEFTYQNKPEARKMVERDGLITNGDIGFIDEDGYLFLVDRRKDMVISGGVNIYPAEIENALAMHQQVADSAVIGIPDSEFGEKVAAFVLPRAGESIDVAELTRFLRERIAGFKVPRVFEFVDSLPRDDSGKLMKRKLRDPYWAHGAAQI